MNSKTKKSLSLVYDWQCRRSLTEEMLDVRRSYWLVHFCHNLLNTIRSRRLRDSGLGIVIVRFAASQIGDNVPRAFFASRGAANHGAGLVLEGQLGDEIG